jgi:hypothetical protein
LGTIVSGKEAVIKKIYDAFSGNEFPDVAFLQGSFEGCEPYEEVGPFRDKRDRKGIKADFLDAHESALYFFSEAGFRFFLPAYLIADLNDQLSIADPLFHLTHGFYDITVSIPKKDRVFVIRSGKSELLNPRRYGALTSYNYARYRLSVFTREEASAIVAYLKYKRDFDPDVIEKERIDAALGLFWLERERTAPLAESLKKHIAEQEEYLAAIRSDIEDSTR